MSKKKTDNGNFKSGSRNNSESGRDSRKGRGSKSFYSNKGDRFDKTGDLSTGGQTKFHRAMKDPDTLTTNDPKTWNKATELFTDATRLLTNPVNGSVIPGMFNPEIAWLPKDANHIATDGKNQAIAIINYCWGPGYATTITDPVNRAFQAMWSEIQSKTTSSVLNFQPQDLAMLVVMATDIAANIAAVKRALEASYVYPSTNYYYPRHIIRSLGFDPDSIIAKQDNVRSALNMAIHAFNATLLPYFFEISEHEYMLNHNIFMDEPGLLNNQLYAFRKQNYYVFKATPDDPSKIESIEAVTFSYNHYGEGDVNTGMNVFDYIQLINDQLNSIALTGFYTRVKAALLKAFPDSAFFYIDPVQPDEASLPVYDANIALQIQNLVLCQVRTDSLDIKNNAETGLIEWKPYSTESSVSLYPMMRWMPLVYNGYDGSPNDIIEATRFMRIYSGETFEVQGQTMNYVEYCGVDLATSITFYDSVKVVDDVEDTETWVWSYSSISSNFTTSPADAVFRLLQFKHHPWITYIGNPSTEVEPTWTGFRGLGVFDKYYQVDRTAMKLLNQAALTSAYMLPTSLVRKNY